MNEARPQTERRARGLPLVLLLLVAAVLHLPSHVSLSGSFREALPEDAAVLVENEAIALRGPGGLVNALGAAVTDPGAHWQDGAGTVGATRWRPVTVVAAVVQRGLFGSSVAQGAALISLLLHLAVVGLTRNLARRVSGSSLGGTAAALLVAASPLALSPADWPARQGIVLATFFGTLGTVVLLGQGGRRGLWGGALLALSGLSHELGFGLAAGAAVLLRLRGGTDAAGRSLRWAAGPAVAAAVWAVRLAGLRAGAEFPGEGADVLGSLLDGCVGLVHAAVSSLLPSRSHLADSPWGSTFVGHVTCGVLVLAALRGLWIHRERPAAGLALAWMTALCPVLAAGAFGAAPYHDHHGYLALPLLAGAVTIVILGALRAGGAGRTGALAAASMLLAAQVAATITRTPAFRSRAGLVELLERDAADDPVTLAWSVGHRMQEDSRIGGDRRAAVLALQPSVERLLERVEGQQGDLLAGSGAAALAVARPLTGFALWTAATDIGPEERVAEIAERAAETAARLVPADATAWNGLAAVRARAGALTGALDAAKKARDLAPDDLDVGMVAADVALRLGDPGSAVLVLVEMRDLAHDAGRPIPTEFKLALARALAAWGGTVGLDQGRPRYRFEDALGWLDEVEKEPDGKGKVRALRHDVLVRYGDFLASTDQPVLAQIAYSQAAQILPKGEGAEHLSWLADNLRQEYDDALLVIEQAASGHGNLADAIAQMAVVLCRAGKFADADQQFAKAAGGDPQNPGILFLRARHRFAWSPEDRDLEIAETLLRQVLELDPELLEARFRLAQVLERRGKLAEAMEQYRRASRAGVLHPWGLEALASGSRIEGWLREVSEVE